MTDVDASPPSPATGEPPRRRWRFYAPAAVTVLLPLSLIWVWRFSDLERGFQVPTTMALVLAGAGVLLVWFSFFTPLSWRTRLLALAPLALAVLALLGLFRFKGFRGDMLPIFERRFAGPIESAALVEGAVDLTQTTPHDRPNFLGPRMDAAWTGVGLETDWQRHPPQILWRQAVGEGFSSFAVVGEFAVTQHQSPDKSAEWTICLHWPTGETRWRHADPGRFTSSLGGNGPRATPAIHNGRVYALGAQGLLSCLDGRHGEVLWSHNIVEFAQAELPEWGKANSPLIVDDLVVVQAGGPRGRSLLAYDQQSGDLVWSAGDDGASYSSPKLAEVDGVRQILSFNLTSCTGHDPATGKILWTIPWPSDHPNVAEPLVIDGDKILLTKEYWTGSALFHVRRDAGAWRVEELWSNQKLMKTKFTNALLHEGHVYGLSDTILQCVEPLEGKLKWHLRGDFGNGQVLLVDDLLLIQTESGALELYPATPQKPQRLARFQVLEGRTWNYPVLVDGHLLMRNDVEAVCCKLPLRGESAPTPEQTAASRHGLFEQPVFEN